MKETELKPCPFCGGKAEIRGQALYVTNSVCIHCTECKARSKIFPCNCRYVYFRGEKNVYISKEQATNMAIELWNRRVDDEQR